MSLYHDVPDVLPDCRCGIPECTGNFFIGPALCETLDNGLFTVTEVKVLFLLVVDLLLPAADLLHDDDDQRLKVLTGVRNAGAANEHRSLRSTNDAPDLKAFPVFYLGSFLQVF